MESKIEGNFDVALYLVISSMQNNHGKSTELKKLQFLAIIGIVRQKIYFYSEVFNHTMLLNAFCINDINTTQANSLI